MYGSMLMGIIAPLLNGYLPSSVYTLISKMNLITFLTSALPSVLGSLGIVGGVALGVGSTIALSAIQRFFSSTFNMNTNMTQLLTVTFVYIFINFVFGGWFDYSNFMVYLLFGQPIDIPGLSVVINFIQPFIESLLYFIGTFMTVMALLYLLADEGMIQLP